MYNVSVENDKIFIYPVLVSEYLLSELFTKERGHM